MRTQVRHKDGLRPTVRKQLGTGRWARATTIAAELGRHPHIVRQALNQMHLDELVHRRLAEAGVGAPAFEYRGLEDGEAFPLYPVTRAQNIRPLAECFNRYTFVQRPRIAA